MSFLNEANFTDYIENVNLWKCVYIYNVWMLEEMKTSVAPITKIADFLINRYLITDNRQYQ